MTRAGEVLGTVAYMSPEQLEGKQADGRADQYSLACSAFELLNGGNGQISAPHKIAPDEFTQTVTYSFQVGNNGINWAWNTCFKDTEAQDGAGLPGSHGCGGAQISHSTSYLG